VEDLYRRSVLGIAGSGPVQRLIERYGFRFGVGRFVAGESLDEALAVVAGLHSQGYTSILDLLGEFVDSRDAVDDIVQSILVTLDSLAAAGPERHMSVKPTQLGLGIDYGLALGNAAAIADRAVRAGVHLCLDMENHPYTDQTLELFTELQERGLSEVSTVLQSYLHRSEADLEHMAGRFPQARVRLVKGAYREPAEVASHDPAVIRRNFLAMLENALAAGMHVAVATHDEKLIEASLQRIRSAGAGARYEFQLLYGIKPRLQSRLLAEGQPVRIYVPYGRDWYGYFSRRLAERPANLAVVARGMFG